MQINIIDHQEYDFSSLGGGSSAALDIGGIVDTASHRSAMLAVKVH